MMTDLAGQERIEKYKRQRPTIAAIWKIDDFEVSGALDWEDDRPILKLNYFAPATELQGRDVDCLPLLKALAAPRQLEVSGFAHGLGYATLMNCVLLGHRVSHHALTPQEISADLELRLMPQQIWLNSADFDFLGRANSVSLDDRRLTGIFGKGRIEFVDNYHEKYSEIAKLLNEPTTVWATYDPDMTPITLGEGGGKLLVDSSLTRSHSSTTGTSTHSQTRLIVTWDAGQKLADVERQISSIEGLISSVCLSHFEFETKTISMGGSSHATQLWRLGEDREKFNSPMAHQCLLPLDDAHNFSKLCKSWFTGNTTDTLAKWLYQRALRETEDGLARFINVCQAFEVLTRNLKLGGKLPKTKMRAAVSAVDAAVRDDFDSEIVSRWKQLISSSNRMSFKDGLAVLLEDIPDELFQQYGTAGREDYCKTISDLRNTLVHMADDNKGRLQSAFFEVNKKSLQITLLFALCLYRRAGISLPNFHIFLYNNDVARHGLPNDLLER